MSDGLMKKRFKVIADFPLSVHAIGEVLTPYDGSTNLCVVEGGFYVTDLSKYPHLFKELHWADEREEKDMPQYVKTDDGKYHKVVRWKGKLATLYERDQYSYSEFARWLTPAHRSRISIIH